MTEMPSVRNRRPMTGSCSACAAVSGYRCGQPGQQQGRRFPSFNSEHTLSIWLALVSGFLTDVVQQIHSLRASGVRLFHLRRAFGSQVNAFRRSVGTSCTTPVAISWCLFAIGAPFERCLNDPFHDMEIHPGCQPKR